MKRWLTCKAKAGSVLSLLALMTSCTVAPIHLTDQTQPSRQPTHTDVPPATPTKPAVQAKTATPSFRSVATTTALPGGIAGTSTLSTSIEEDLPAWCPVDRPQPEAGMLRLACVGAGNLYVRDDLDEPRQLTTSGDVTKPRSVCIRVMTFVLVQGRTSQFE